MSFEKGKDREEKIDKFLDIMAWFHSEKTMPTGAFATIGRIAEHLAELNKNIVDANESSTKLTKALNNITLVGVVIAGSGIVIAALNLAFEIFKYAHGK